MPCQSACVRQWKATGKATSQERYAGFLVQLPQCGVEKVGILAFSTASGKGDVAAPGVFGERGPASQKHLGLRRTSFPNDHSDSCIGRLLDDRIHGEINDLQRGG